MAALTDNDFKEAVEATERWSKDKTLMHQELMDLCERADEFINPTEQLLYHQDAWDRPDQPFVIEFRREFRVAAAAVYVVNRTNEAIVIPESVLMDIAEGYPSGEKAYEAHANLSSYLDGMRCLLLKENPSAAGSTKAASRRKRRIPGATFEQDVALVECPHF